MRRPRRCAGGWSYARGAPEAPKNSRVSFNSTGIEPSTTATDGGWPAGSTRGRLTVQKVRPDGRREYRA